MGRGRGKERRGEERWIRREGGDPRGGGEEKEERRGEERRGRMLPRHSTTVGH
jgi:hypothetical protein